MAHPGGPGPPGWALEDREVSYGVAVIGRFHCISSWPDYQQPSTLTFEVTDINMTVMGYVLCMWEVVVMVWGAIAMVAWYIACIRRLHVRSHVRKPVGSLNANMFFLIHVRSHVRKPMRSLHAYVRFSRLHVRSHVRKPFGSLNALVSIPMERQCLHHHKRHRANYQKLQHGQQMALLETVRRIYCLPLCEYDVTLYIASRGYVTKLKMGTVEFH